MSLKQISGHKHFCLPEWLILFFLLLSFAACDSREDSDKQRFLIRGNEALGQQNYREATRFFNEAIAIDSCYVPALNNAGIVQFEQQHFGQAIMFYNQALRCDPDNYNATLNRANAFYESGQLYSAEDDLLYLQRKYPDSATLYFRMGLVHAKMKDFDKSVLNFTTSLSLDSTDAEAWVNRGTVHYYLDNLEKAENDLRKALRLSPSEAIALNSLAMLYTKRGELTQARQYVEEALAFIPEDPYFLNNLGYILLLQGDLEEGREKIDYSIARDPNNAWAYRNKGRYYYLRENYQDALRLYARALREDDFVELIHTFRGDALMATGNNQEACAAWQQGVSQGEREAGDRLIQHACP